MPSFWVGTGALFDIRESFFEFFDGEAAVGVGGVGRVVV
jgi:hypothetical protein